jgi:hypothetical protein
MKLPPGWRRPIHIADAGGREPVDSRAARTVINDGQFTGSSIPKSQGGVQVQFMVRDACTVISSKRMTFYFNGLFKEAYAAS